MTAAPVNDTRLSDILRGIDREVRRASKTHAPLHSLHEGHSVIQEEFEEFWDEVKRRHPDMRLVYAELKQTAAMCVRLMHDVVMPAMQSRFDTATAILAVENHKPCAELNVDAASEAQPNEPPVSPVEPLAVADAEILVTDELIPA